MVKFLCEQRFSIRAASAGQGLSAVVAGAQARARQALVRVAQEYPDPKVLALRPALSQGHERAERLEFPAYHWLKQD